MRPILITVAAVLAVLSAGAFVVEVVPIVGGSSLEVLCRVLPCPVIQQGISETGAERIARLERAVEREPASPYAWCSLGEAFRENGSAQKAAYCMSRAVDLGGSIPSILMRSANFHFSEGDTDAALTATARILELVNSYDEVIFSSYRRFGVPISRVLSHGLPADSRPRQGFFRHLLNWGESSQVQLTWETLARESRTNDDLAGLYIDYLLSRGLCGQAMNIWPVHLGERRGDYPEANLLFHGGFEDEPTGTRLDWQIDEVDGVTVERTPEAYAGEYALKLTFEGTQNVAYSQTSQSTCLSAGEYVFQATVRSEGITTDQAPYFRISEHPPSDRIHVQTSPWAGTQEWTTVKASFLLTASMTPVVVQIRRDQSLQFDNKIRGYLWVDDVRITKVR